MVNSWLDFLLNNILYPHNQTTGNKMPLSHIYIKKEIKLSLLSSSNRSPFMNCNLRRWKNNTIKPLVVPIYLRTSTPRFNLFLLLLSSSSFSFSACVRNLFELFNFLFPDYLMPMYLKEKKTFFKYRAVFQISIIKKMESLENRIVPVTNFFIIMKLMESAAKYFAEV